MNETELECPGDRCPMRNDEPASRLIVFMFVSWLIAGLLIIALVKAGM